MGVDAERNGTGREDVCAGYSAECGGKRKVHHALRRGEDIPEDWAEAFKSVMLPMAGPK